MRTLLFAYLLALATATHAQVTVAGTVTALDGAPLQGVNVYVASTYEGASTDSLGRFAFESTAALPHAVHTQYLGYRADSATVDGTPGARLHLRLRPAAAALAEVVVSAGAFVASDTRKVAVLSSVDVATTGATADLAEALSTLPGSTPAGESGQLLVRGGSAAETQAYINGLRVPKLYTSGLPDVPSRTRFSPFAFEGITFATGGFSAAYGDALSGALLLQTRGLPERTLTQVSLLSLGGEVSRVQRLGDRQALAVSAGGTHLGLYRPLSREAQRKLTTVPQGLNAQAAYWWRGRDGRNLKTFAQASTQHFASDDPGEARFYGASRLRLDNRNAIAQAVYQQPRGATGLWTVGASAAGNRDRIRADTSDVALDQVDLSARVAYADNHRDVALWRVGAEHGQRRERVDVFAPAERPAVAQRRRAYSAAFAEADWYLAGRWVLRTGLRADAYASGARAGLTDYRAQLSPRGQLSYLFSAAHQLAASAGRYVQRQTDDALFAVAHDLPAQRLDYYGLTYSRTWGRRVLRAEAYAKTYRDLLTVDPDDGTLGTAGHGYARGLDVFYRDRASVEDADFWVSYSLNDSRRRRGALAEPAPVPFAARHNLAVVAKRFFPAASFGVSCTYRYHSGRPYDDPNDPVHRFGGSTPDLHDLSVNVTYLTQLRGHFTVLFASLSNVAGARQVHQYRYARQPDERGVYDRLEVDGLFPSFPFVGLFVSIGDRDRVGTVDDI